MLLKIVGQEFSKIQFIELFFVTDAVQTLKSFFWLTAVVLWQTN